MRITAISDLHGQFPREIPECDVLVVAGDVCPDLFYENGKQRSAQKRPDLQLRWFEDKFIPWVEKQPAKTTLITWGNHDFCGQMDDPFLPKDCTTQWDGAHDIYVVVDSYFDMGGIKFWLTPWSNQFFDWAWMKHHAALGDIYARIPEDIDVLVSHQPPYGFGDLYPNPVDKEHIGSSELLYHIDRMKPQAVICGHLHDGHGIYVHGPTTIFNVSIMDDRYRLVHAATEFEVLSAKQKLSGGQTAGVEDPRPLP